MDIQLSADQKVVLVHDFILDDTTHLKGCVQDYTYAQLSTADATVGSAAKTKVGVPLLNDALEVAARFKRKVNIEIKVDEAGKTCKATDIAALVNAAVNVVKDAHAEESVVFSSFSFAALEQVKKKLPTVPVGYLTAEGGEQLLIGAERALEAGFEAINPIYFVLTQDPNTFSALDKLDIQIIPWTVNDEDDMRELLLGGADAMITDDPALAIRIRDETVPVCDCTSAVKNDTESSSGCETTRSFSWIPVLLAFIFLFGIRRLRS